jgi:hypothetical protein
MTIEDFFNQFPLQEPKELTQEDLRKVLSFTLASVNGFSKDDKTLTKDEKIASYKSFCRKKIDEAFPNLTLDGKTELDKFFNLYGTHAILQHLAD